MKHVIQVKVREDQRAIIIHKVDNKDLGLEFLRNHVGLSDGSSYIQCVYKVFPTHPQIMIVVDEEGALKNFNPTLYTGKELLVGDALICAIRQNEYGERDLFGMTLDETFFILVKIPSFICSILHLQS